MIPANTSWTNTANNPDIGATANGSANCRNLTLLSNSRLAFSSATSEIDICGDLTDNGVTLTYGSNGKVKFIGTVAQNIIRTGGGPALHNVEINNTATTPLVTLKEGNGYKDLNLDATGVLTFTNGVLVIEGSRAVEIKNTATGAITGHGASKYVYGRVRRYVVTGTAYDFPVGGNPSGATVYPYELMNINFTSITGLTYLTVCFDNPNNTTGTNVTTQPGLPLSEQSSNYTSLIDNGGANAGSGVAGPTAGIWTVIPDAGTATYDMTLYGKNYDNDVGAGTYYSVLKRATYSMCSTIPSWTLNGNINAISSTATLITAKRSGMSGFSQFAIAKHTTPLPVELLAFDASCINGSTVLSWATASETNNDYFILERSCDENYLQYQQIAKIKGAGTINTMKQYSFADNDATPGSCYYRLSQTDFNGTTVEFSPISINCKESAGFNFISALPSPATDEVSILFSSDNIGNVQMHVNDMLGQQLFSKEIKAEAGLNVYKLDLTGFAEGVYFISLTNGSKSFLKKVVKKN